MNLFGMGAMEIAVILIVALVIFGPSKLPEIGGQVGRAVKDFRRATRDLTAEFRDRSMTQSTISEMKATVTDVRNETARCCDDSGFADIGNQRRTYRRVLPRRSVRH
jgi:TatA/E family protein of Tat protein translocase